MWIIYRGLWIMAENKNKMNVRSDLWHFQWHKGLGIARDIPGAYINNKLLLMWEVGSKIWCRRSIPIFQNSCNIHEYWTAIDRDYFFKEIAMCSSKENIVRSSLFFVSFTNEWIPHRLIKLNRIIQIS